MHMKAHVTVCVMLIAGIIFLIISMSPADAALCQKIGVSFTYPTHAFENQAMQVSTTVAGSCVSDGEDYFALRVDLVDNFTGGILSSNSTPIGYNANNFSVTVRNAAVTPSVNESWPVIVDTYLIQAGATSGKYLLNATTITIQVGSTQLAEFSFNPSWALAVLLMTTTLTLTYRVRSKNGTYLSRERIE
jgi:hypothetical protein